MCADPDPVQVVLPDAKRSENDVVVFLDDSLAAPDAAEAEQRAAVAALHRVAGERQLHMLLPPQYRDVWQAMRESASKRAAEHAARTAAVEQRRERDKERRERMAMRGPKVTGLPQRNWEGQGQARRTGAGVGQVNVIVPTQLI